jgi:hypothetical protein
VKPNTIKLHADGNITCKTHRLRVFENRVLRRIFGPRGWIKLSNKEL